MTDYDYWKKQYQDSWGKSSERETEIAAQLSQATGREIRTVGLGAGSAEFLTGSAAQQGHTKGDADLNVVGTNIYLEVTGPLVTSVVESAPLWIRPDKVQNARQKAPAQETWVVHHLPRNGLVRVVHLSGEFFAALDAGEFPIVTPRIRGVTERYHEIAAGHRCVKAYDALIERLRRA
ncbi:MAG: hypothetical protein JJU36_05835 [Phycisphaeraceae bacterium]|nr:hypothetical protein [Phycisphaeraceae bacterium]